MSGAQSPSPTDWNSVVRFPAGAVDPYRLQNAVQEVRSFLAQNSPLTSLTRHKPHLLLPAIYALSQSEDILFPVRDFLGTDDFFLWYSVLFVKEKHTTGRIPWHYDDYFWGLEARGGCTAWVALNDVTVENGAMEFAPDTVDAAQMFVQFEDENLLVRGNNSTFTPRVASDTRHIELKAGQFSIHSNKAWHRSGPNLSSKDRLAVAFRYITAPVTAKKFQWLQRGAVPRAGKSLPPLFYVEHPPLSELSTSTSRQHKKSILISAFLTCFGDANRSFSLQLWDFITMMKTTRFLKLFANMALSVFGKNKLKDTKSSVFQKINDG